MTESPSVIENELLSTAGIIGSLRRAGAELDKLWLQAVTHGSEDSVRLAEASQDVHRALIALTFD